MCLNPGDIIGGHYRIKGQLGRGGFGSTYLAEEMHLPNNPERVVKEITPSSNDPCVLQEAEKRFNKEALALYCLGTHPQIPQLFERFQENGKFYLVQELISGQPLSEELTPGRQLNEEKVIELLQGILEVLKFVHQQEVIHRDIKPSNLIRRKQDGKIVLIDFGAVKEISTLAVTYPGKVTPTASIGTEGYMPAEQAYGQPKYNSDVYAVGMIGIQAIMGLNPKNLSSDKDTGEIIWRYSIPGKPMVQVSDSLATVLDKMVRYHFSDRYQSADDVLQALDDVLQASTVQKPPPPLKQESSTWELLRQAAIAGSGSWLLAMTLVSFIVTVWISAALWLLISGYLIFGVFAKNSSILKKIWLFITAVIATGATFFLLPQNFHNWIIIKAWSKVLLVVVLLAIVSGLFAFIILVISQSFNSYI